MFSFLSRPKHIRNKTVNGALLATIR